MRENTSVAQWIPPLFRSSFFWGGSATLYSQPTKKRMPILFVPWKSTDHLRPVPTRFRDLGAHLLATIQGVIQWIPGNFWGWFGGALREASNFGWLPPIFFVNHPDKEFQLQKGHLLLPKNPCKQSGLILDRIDRATPEALQVL